MPEVRIDAVAQGDALSLDLAEELQQLAPVRDGQPERLAAGPGRDDVRPARARQRGPPHLVHAQRGRRPLALRGLRRRRHAAGRRPASPPTPPSGWRSTAGTAPSRRGWCCARRTAALPRAIDVLGEPPTFADGVRRELDATWRPRARAGDAADRAASRRRTRRAARPRPARHRHRRHPRGPRRDRRAGARRDRARATSRARACRPCRRVRAHVVGGARGRSRPRRAVPARRRGRPADALDRCTIRKARAGPTWRGGRLN